MAVRNIFLMLTRNAQADILLELYKIQQVILYDIYLPLNTTAYVCGFFFLAYGHPVSQMLISMAKNPNEINAQT